MNRLFAKARHFLGQDLPVRDIPLKFTLPGSTGKFDTPSSGSATFYRDMSKSKDFPGTQLRLIRMEVPNLNRRSIRPAQRLTLTRDMVALFYPLVSKQLTAQARLSAIPESDEQGQILDDILATIRTLIISYQILFSGYYSGNNYQYRRGHSIVLECASQIFELLRLKQRVMAQRYQVLTEQDWQTANTLFYVMSKFDDVEQELPPMQRLGGTEGVQNLREQFTLLHMVAKFDMLRWPAHLQLIIATYFHNANHAVSVITNSKQKSMGRDDLVTYCYSTEAASPAVITDPQQGQLQPRFDSEQLDKPLGPKMVLSCASLFSAIKKDCMSLIQAKHTNRSGNIPSRFSIFSENDHLVIANQLLTGMEGTVAVQLSKETELNDLRIYVEFLNLFALFRHRQSAYKSEQRLADVLAMRSAMFADDQHAVEKTLWILLAKTEKMMRLSTHETNHTTPLSVGSLIAYGVGEDINRPKLAMISRIHRPSGQVVEVDFQAIASYAEAVSITLNGADREKSTLAKAKPALLVHDESRPREWGLIIAPQSILPGFDTFTMTRNDQELLVELKNWRYTTPTVSYFTTTLTSAQLGVEGNPVYEDVVSQSRIKETGISN